MGPGKYGQRGHFDEAVDPLAKEEGVSLSTAVRDLVNRMRGKVLAFRIGRAVTFLRRLRALLGKPALTNGERL